MAETTHQGKSILRGGTVITCDPELGTLEQADILIENGKISAIASRIDEPGTVVVDVGGKVVMPGLIDTHRHVTDAIFSGLGGDMTLMEYFRNAPGHYFSGDYMRRACKSGAYLALDAGVTTVVDWSLSAHTLDAAEAALAGFEEAGGRTIFAYGPGSGVIGDNPDLSKSPLHTDSGILKKRCASNKQGLLDLWVAGRGPDFVSFEVARDEILFLQDLGLRASMHVGGSAVEMKGGTLRCAEAGLLGPDLHFVHCCNLSKAEMEAMADAGVTACVTPYAEATTGLGPNPYLRLLDAGVIVGLGTDSVAVAAGQGLFNEARALLVLERDRKHLETLQKGQDPETNEFITSEMVIRSLTIDAAASIGLADSIGSLTPGKWADIITLDKRRLGVVPLNLTSALILSGESRAVDMVFVAGQVKKWGGKLADNDYDAVIDDLADIRANAPLRHIGE